jgi:predicted CxxxxCH...CXXCH cytochrome family protein
MLKKTLYSRWLIPMLVIAMVGMLIGCGNEVADDWDPLTPEEARHPFESRADHGEYLATGDYDFSGCTECHGESLRGVELGDPMDPVRACTDCHRTDNHIVYFDNAFIHTQWLGDNGYMMDDCYICHAPFDASPDSPAIEFGSSCASAVGCHDTALGPMACNTCHGEMDEDSSVQENWAPDRGAHSTHLANSGPYATITCTVCHTQPTTPEQSGHYNDDTPGEIELTFRDPANADDFDPEWSEETSTCSNVYCHGGNDMDWRLENVEFTCASCHTYPPEGSHPDIDNCVLCHNSVVGPDGDDEDDFVDIIAPLLHINGAKDFNE